MVFLRAGHEQGSSSQNPRSASHLTGPDAAFTFTYGQAAVPPAHRSSWARGTRLHWSFVRIRDPPEPHAYLSSDVARQRPPTEHLERPKQIRSHDGITTRPLLIGSSPRDPRDPTVLQSQSASPHPRLQSPQKNLPSNPIAVSIPSLPHTKHVSAQLDHDILQR